MLFVLNSCFVSRKIVYFNDLLTDTAYKTNPIPPIRVQKNDRLSIQVSAKDPELAIPFNNQAGLYNFTDNGEFKTSLIDRGYLVDQQGNIDFPSLGTLNIEGMTLDGVREFIKEKLVSNKLLSSPVVKVELLNLKVIMMGESGNRVIDAPDGRLTILEAITRAGGLSNNASTNKIGVIREENGERKVYLADIEKKSIFDSPIYYLQQNDIVYIEPKASVVRGDEARTWRVMGMILSIISVSTTIWAISTR